MWEKRLVRTTDWQPFLSRDGPTPCASRDSHSPPLSRLRKQDYRSMRFNATILFPWVEHINYFPWRKVCFCSLFLACVFIPKAFIMNFSEVWDVGILHLSTKYELNRSKNNGDLSSDRKKNENTHRVKLRLSPKRIKGQSYPLLPLEEVLKQDLKHAFILNLTHGVFSSAKHKGENRSKTIGQTKKTKGSSKD